MKLNKYSRMKKYLQSLLLVVTLLSVSAGVSAQVLLDQHSSSNGASTWNITTTHTNELILVSTGGCCAGLNTSAGTVKVNGVNATYMLGTNCSGFFPCYIWACVAPAIGTYTIVCTEAGGISSPWYFNYAVSVYEPAATLTLGNIILGGTNTNVGPTTITTTITTTVANAYVYGFLVENDNFNTGVISWNGGLTYLDYYYEALASPGVDGSQAGMTKAAAGLYSITATDLGATNPYAAIALIAVQPPVPLPINLINFSCQGTDGSIKVYWSTASEDNSSRFTIERSSDGITFKPYATVPATGNSETQQNYTYTDETPLVGDNYYRLTETDLDGDTHTYYVTMCTNDKAPVNQIYPNPSNGSFTVALGASSNYQTLVITDMLGRQVFTEQFAPSVSPAAHSIELPSTLKGMYVATILDNNQAIAVKKLVIY